MAGVSTAVTTGPRSAKTIGNAVTIITVAASFLYTFHVLCCLMLFTSRHNVNQKNIAHSVAERSILMTLWILMVDASLVSLFMLQHSFMATDAVKSVYRRFKSLSELERSIYNAASAAALHFLMNTWQPIPWVPLWDVDTTESNKLWLLFVGFHTLGWFIVYSGCVMMDISELAGLKQVYYKFTARPCPLSVKSRDLQRYYAHMRHPSFTGFLIILWIHPFMTLDRFLLSSLLTVYMIMMWTLDEEDCRYHAKILQRKRHHLS